MTDTAKKPIFRPLSADDPEPEVTEIESLCMECYEKGTTRLLLTKIPFYKDVVLFSFSCEHCGYENNEIQSGGQIAEKGIRFTLDVQENIDLNRRIVKSDYTCVKIVDLDFEIPSQSQKGEVTTVEGILDRSIRGLQQDQPVRKLEHKETAEKIDEFIKKLEELKSLEKKFSLIIEDISGNSYVENPNAPRKDPRCSVQHFSRTDDQKHSLGLYSQQEISEQNDETGILHPISEDEFTLEQLENDEILQFTTNCTNCNNTCQTNMKVTNIPHFKEVIIMATNCEICGHKTNEIKSGGGIEPKALKIDVKVSNSSDFTRDILKSETCYLRIPELDLDLGPTTLGGRFTTIEGILVAIRDQLCNQGQAFVDSESPEVISNMQKFIDKLESVLEGKLEVTVCLDDPAGNSYVQSLSDDGELDDKLKIMRYERSFDQNEELGLNDIKTENY